MSGGRGHLAAMGGVRGEPGLVILRAGDGARRHGGDAVGGCDLGRRGDGDDGDALRQRRGDGGDEIGVAHQHASAAVAEDEDDLLGLEVPIDGHGIGAERLRGVGRLDEGDVVAHEDGDAIAARHAERRQPRRRAPHALVERRPADAPRAADELGCRVCHAACRLSFPSRRKTSASRTCRVGRNSRRRIAPPCRQSAQCAHRRLIAPYALPTSGTRRTAARGSGR